MIPEQLESAIIANRKEYKRGKKTDFTVTEICTPAPIVKLRREYKDQIKVDPEDLIYSLIGSTIHKILDSADNAIREKRLYADYMGYTISGQFDRICLSSGKKINRLQKVLIKISKKYRSKFCFILQDYKVCSIYEYMNLKEERKIQMSGYVWLLRQNGYNVTSVEIIQIFRDWSKIKALSGFGGNYPPKQYAVYKMEMEDIAGRFELQAKLFLSLYNRELFSNCAKEERWTKGEKWALMKKNRKTAIKLYDNEESAKKALTELDKQHYIEYRQGEDLRCKYYCEVAEFCNYGKRYKNNDGEA